MTLTKEQAQLVADNEKLIYWYIGLKHLDIEEWYGLLAIELCKTVMTYDDSKGSLSNYYKLRCDWVLTKEYRTRNTIKRKAIITELKEEHYANNHTEFNLDDVVAENMLMEELFSGHLGQVAKLKYLGYNQKEIANMLGVSQAKISYDLRKIKRRILGNDR